jgi:putative ABC transport system substrate-binding protein
MAAKIIKGEAKASGMPYETISEYSIYINSGSAAELGIEIPAAIADKAVESTDA